ncbi:MAG: PEP/pyruvate-binding domain-containing protein [Motiliproteus sp.]
MNSPVHQAHFRQSQQTPVVLQPWLLPLAQISADQQTLVGNKALQLGRLQQAGFAVPNGFCITSAALADAPRDRLPAELERQIIDAWRQLDGSGPVAVRSSAAEEDGKQNSWAGLFHTSLNVHNAESLLKAVCQCWQSLHSDTVTAFRRQKGRSVRPSMAVIVQRQVPASCAGVMFSRNPLHSERPEICVNALWGLAEPLVSGQQDGDHFTVDRQGQLLQQRLSHQTERLTSKGVQPVALEQGAKACLSANQLRQLADAGDKLERLLECPQDIEFAFQGEQLWLLQSRPIVVSPAASMATLERYRQDQISQLESKLQRLQQQQILRHGAGILSNGNISELLPTPTPMSFDLFRQLFTASDGGIPQGRKALGYQINQGATEELFTLVAGQPYFHLELDARTYDLSQRQPIDHYLAEVRKSPALANYPEYGLYQQQIDQACAMDLLGREKGLLFESACQQHYEQMVDFGNSYYSRYRQQIEPALVAHRRSALAQSEQASDSPDVLLGRINYLTQHLQQVSCYHFVIAARLGFYFAESVRHQLNQYLPDQAQEFMGLILQALPGSLVSEQMLDLGALKAGQLSHQQFLRRYGHLASTELEISLPRYHEAPEQLQHLVAVPQQRTDSRQMFRRQLRQRKAVEAQLRQLLQRQGIEPAAIARLMRDLRLARHYLPLRETIKYHFAAEYDLLRQLLLRFSSSVGLVQQQIFYLHLDELRLCIDDRRQAQALIEDRSQQHQLAKSLAAVRPLSAVIFGDNIGQGFDTTLADSRQHWRGEGIAPGIRRGRLRLLDEDSDLIALAGRLQPDDILVTRSANLGLAPLLRSVAGLIVEVGGFLAHAACQAREAGIPAIVLPDATRRLQDGMDALLDGGHGTVNTLEGNTEPSNNH